MVKSKQKTKRKNNGRRPKPRGLKLFIKTFLISTCVLSVMIFCGWIFLHNWIKPPDIPPQETYEPIVWQDDLDSAAYSVPEFNKEDTLIGDGHPAPRHFTPSDRKADFYTFVIVGIDKGTNTDTIMVASYDGVNNAANIIGIPRDSLVNVKRRVKKINAAYGAGTLDGGGREGGIEQLKRELKTIIGFMPDYYVLIDLKAFVEIVDAVDGVYVDVPINLDYDDPEQDLHIHINKGPQTLDGKEALKFARYRKGNDSRNTITDYKRIENQQAVINAVLARLIKPESILKIPEFIDIFNKNVYSDLKTENMFWFADQLSKVRGTDALSMYTIPTTGTSGPPNYYEYLDESAIVELVNKTINPYIKDIEAKDLDIISVEPD